MVFGDSRMVSGEVASKLHSRGPFQASLRSDSECILPKVEVAGSIPVSRSIFQYDTRCPGRQFCGGLAADLAPNSCLILARKSCLRVQLFRKTFWELVVDVANSWEQRGSGLHISASTRYTC